MENGPALIDGSSSRASTRRFEPRGTAAGLGSGPAPCDVRMVLAADAEQVVLVRHTIAAMAAVLGLDSRAADDVKLAVTEACTNVVRHAYGDDAGSMTVHARVEDARLHITVSDQGCGLRPRLECGPAGLGLPLMAAVADAIEIEEADGVGTTVRLSFAPGQ